MAEEMTNPVGPFTVWTNYSCYENWRWQDFETLKEAVEFAGSNMSTISWTITKPVNYSVTEVGE